jgi:molybdate transport system ATP-binding protein
VTTQLHIRGVELAQGAFRLRVDAQAALGCLGIFGPSGSGKTSLLEVLAGLRRPHAGRVQVDDLVLCDRAARIHVPAHRRRIGYVPQDLALFPHLDVRGNIQYGARAGGGAPLREMLELLELAPLLDRRVAGLSGGERRRVAIARALAAQPRLLLLDEPFTGLDVRLRDNALRLLRELRQRLGVPMIYVSHQADEVVALCDDVLVLHEGEVVAQGRPADLFESTGEPRYRLRAPL